MSHAYSFGIEEEFFLADARTRGSPGPQVRDFHASVESRVANAEREMLESQIEICSPPSESFGEAAERLGHARAALAAIGREHGILVFAAGTHPTALWRQLRATDAERYDGILGDLRMVGRRSVVCGTHVHVAVADPEARVGLANRLLPFAPLLLALSAGSPFWQGRATGLAAYRLRVYAELPRTGLPDLFEDAADYARYVRIMTRTGAIADASFLWWILRVSPKYPTLELRIADSCPHLPDALAIAALFRCLVRRVERDPGLNGRLTGASRGFITENLWRAERDGVRAELIDEAAERAVPVPEALESLLALIAEDAAALGCAEICADARRIAAEGTSADRQIRTFESARSAGMGRRAALSTVVDALARETEGAADPAVRGA